jgi:putative glutamine amidotransferase
MKTKPIVGIMTSEIDGFNGRQLLHSAGKRYVDSVMNFSKIVPVLIPTCIKKNDLRDFLTVVDGVLLTGGRANIEPHHFGGKKFPADEHIDPERDFIALEIVKECVKLEMPIFGVCRGIQEINVAHGGTLFYRVHQESGKDDHRMPQNDDALLEDIFKPRHIISFTEGSIFKKFSGQDNFLVNTLHGQGIDQLGKGLLIEALSEDGLVEALSIKDYRAFGVGIQWHPEFHPERDENHLNKILFEKFGESCRVYHSKKL